MLKLGNALFRLALLFPINLFAICLPHLHSLFILN